MPFLGKLYKDPLAPLETSDLEPELKSRYDGALGGYLTAFVFGYWPLRRYYLVAISIDGSIELQTLIYVIREYRFSGWFGLHRMPRFRKRTLNIGVRQLGLRLEETSNLWQQHIDSDWRNNNERTLNLFQAKRMLDALRT